MSLINNQQLFAEAYIQEMREARVPVDSADSCREIIREWRDEYPSLEGQANMIAYLAQCFSALGLSYMQHTEPDHFVLFGDETLSQPLGVCLAVTDDNVGRTTKRRHHQARLIKLLRERKLDWGIVTNGRIWRLCYASASAPTKCTRTSTSMACLTGSTSLILSCFTAFLIVQPSNSKQEPKGRLHAKA